MDGDRESLPNPFEVEIESELFKGSKIYYSGSIRGQVTDPLIGYEIVRFMLENSAEVLSAHVAARNKDEMIRTFFQRSGKGLDDEGNDIRTPEMAYEIDMAWVDEATHIVSIVDGPSHGVGMEIMRALMKPFRGLNYTPALCLVSNVNFDKLSWMITGAHSEFGDGIKVATYSTAEDAKEIIKRFLTDDY